MVCAGGSGACEADLNVLGTVVFNLGRFGIQFVASRRDRVAVEGSESKAIGDQRTRSLPAVAKMP